MNKKHSEMLFRTLANMPFVLHFYCFRRFYAFLEDFEIFDPLKFFPDTRYFVTLFSNTRKTCVYASRLVWFYF